MGVFANLKKHGSRLEISQLGKPSFFRGGGVWCLKQRYARWMVCRDFSWPTNPVAPTRT